MSLAILSPITGDSPRARLHDPIQSHLAADASSTTKTRVEDAVLEIVFALNLPDGDDVNTFYKLNGYERDYPEAAWDTPRKRLSDLLADGFITRIDKGSRGGVYALTLAGLHRIGRA